MTEKPVSIQIEKDSTSSLSHSTHRPGGHRQHHRRQPRKEWHQKLWKTPKEATVALCLAADKKVHWSLDKYLILSIYAGFYVGIGCLVAITVGYGNPLAPISIKKLFFGLTFPVALVLIVFLGGELFTGNTMYFTMGWLNGNTTLRSGLMSWVVSYIGNYAGTQLFAFLFGYVTEMFIEEPYLSAVWAISEAKVSHNFGVTFLRAIPANFLVCTAIFLQISAEDMFGKLLAIYIPVSAFAIIGFEHCIANMFLVPIGIMYGAPNATYAQFIYKSLIPSTLGNIVGGGFFMGAMLWYLYICGQEDAVPTNPKQKPSDFDLKRWTPLVWMRLRNEQK